VSFHPLIEVIVDLQGIYEATSKSLSLQHSSLLDKNPLEEEEDDDDAASQTDDPGFHTSLRVGVIIYKNADEPVTRINTLHKFQEVNRRMLANVTYALPVDQKDRSLIDQRAQISADSVVGESTQISERTTIKRSVIGRHCVIGKMVKITGCVLLDHCVVEDG
jgi:translation initiation factor eIF-2B subunit gamma